MAVFYLKNNRVAAIAADGAEKAPGTARYRNPLRLCHRCEIGQVAPTMAEVLQT